MDKLFPNTGLGRIGMPKVRVLTTPIRALVRVTGPSSPFNLLGEAIVETIDRYGDGGYGHLRGLILRVSDWEREPWCVVIMPSGEQFQGETKTFKRLKDARSWGNKIIRERRRLTQRGK